MKYTTLIIAMVIGSYCWGQKKDSVSILDAGQDSYMLLHSIQPKQDTIKVLMLVCDTVKYSESFYIPPRIDDYKYMNGVWWQFGYEVYEMEYGSMPCNANVGTSAIAVACFGWHRSKFINYLDQNKKPLPKSIVVWMTKEIK